jgi:hypothetical protein
MPPHVSPNLPRPRNVRVERRLLARRHVKGMSIASIVPLMSALLALGATQTPQPPTEPPAALRRPNLQVMTAVPESQLFLVMNAISDSLGVRCDYCHVRTTPDPTKTWFFAGGWNWDRDDKKQKLVAREMMRMVVDINQRQFGGRMVVTCYTCHRGAVAPDRFPPLPPRAYSFDPEPAARPLPSADDVWRAYLTGAGGTARRFTTTVMSATDDRSEGRRGTFEVVFKGTDRFRVTQRMPPDGPTSQALVGDAGWVGSDSGSRALRPDELARVRRTALRYGATKVERPSNLRIAGIERVGSRDAYVAVSDVDNRTKLVLFFDTATGLLVRERTTTETSFIPLQDQVDYEDYRNVDGVMLPFVIRSSDGAPFDTSVKSFTSIRHDVDVDDSTFALPARVARQVGGPAVGAVR